MYYNGYVNLYGQRPPQGGGSLYLVPPATIQQQLNQGRIGHYFQTMIGNRPVVFQLISINPATGMIGMNINGQYSEYHSNDLVGLTYLGPTPPWGGQGGGWGGQGGGWGGQGGGWGGQGGGWGGQGGGWGGQGGGWGGQGGGWGGQGGGQVGSYGGGHLLY